MHSPSLDIPNQYQSKPSNEHDIDGMDREISLSGSFDNVAHPIKAIENKKLQDIIRKLCPRLVGLSQHRILFTA